MAWACVINFRSVVRFYSIYDLKNLCYILYYTNIFTRETLTEKNYSNIIFVTYGNKFIL